MLPPHDRPARDPLPPEWEALGGLRVALFTGNYNYLKEGANQALNRLVKHLEERVGAQARVYSPVTATPAFPPEGMLVPVASVPLPGRPEFRLALGLPRAARRDLAGFAPQLVHVATPDILCTRAETYARRAGLPLVASLHTRFEEYLDYYRLGRLRGLVEYHLDRFYRRADMILVPTPAIRAEMTGRHGADKVRVWARGVDAALFSPARRSEAWRAARGLRPDEVALLFFGRLVLEKGTDRFAEVVNGLRGGPVPVRPVIVGDGPARERMRAALPDAIFTGHIQGDALATAIASSDILICPSTTETFGNVTLEAMASGLAVVTADVPSARNLIEDGVSGLLCPPDSAAYIARAAPLVADPARRHALGESARAAALRWRWDEVLDAVLASYAAVLGRGLAAHRSFDEAPRGT